MWLNKQTPANIIFPELQMDSKTKHTKGLIFTLGSIARLALVGELFQNIHRVTIQTGYINMPGDGFVSDNSNKAPSPSPISSLNLNCILNHLASFYYIQMPGLRLNPIKKEHPGWLGNRCVLTAPPVMLICSQG